VISGVFLPAPYTAANDTICGMADSAWVSSLTAAAPATTVAPRHPAAVRITHGITAVCFFALLITGAEIVLSHPRFYWGETGNIFTPPLFELPLPSSRPSVPTGYGFVLPDQNGWSRALHFQAAWVLVLSGLFYIAFGLVTGHFRKRLLPAVRDLRWDAFSNVIASHLRLKPPNEAEVLSYNVLQRLSYLFVIFVLFPLMIWTGLAMSPAFAAAFPAAVTTLGGQQSARTFHFFGTAVLLVFLAVHVSMIFASGFRSRVRAMITGAQWAERSNRE
jgi:thiosulfate reductase cytochrome b subunit